MPDFPHTDRVDRLFNATYKCCMAFRHEFFTPEHLLFELLKEQQFYELLNEYASPSLLEDQIEQKLRAIPPVPEGIEYTPQGSMQFGTIMEYACQQVLNSNAKAIDVPHLLSGLLLLSDSWACYLLKDALKENEEDFISNLITLYEMEEVDDLSDDLQQEPWMKMVTCLNDMTDRQKPLVGREAELERTIQVLCRREKNNPLHVGEPGVGKTALVYGLVDRIERGDVPPRLQGCIVYQLDLGTLLAGTQYRGDFEKRIKQIMEGVAEVGNAIVYIDEIHNLVGAGAVGESSMDASNMLKPYLEQGSIRFIGSTTYDEYNRHFSRSKGLVRRFQQIDILEPSVEETINILKQLRPVYENFHHVSYDDKALEYAASASAKYINDRFLPDKAIDLIDEAGAAAEMQLQAERNEPATITEKQVALILKKTCKMDTAASEEEENRSLAALQENMLAQIYGQDEAVRQVVEAVQMAKAGLTDDDKPIASLLFVGPTGVGKTEVARVLAHELQLELVRFDMSEYTEKHAVAKLIGSPAGYVGYEDGGLLTDAIRKTPHAVLLLDEIEKAHSDIYNILLQVMDYARLTDNKGKKADFRNVVLIMTSNAGARYATQASVGFQSKVSRGEAMLQQVKKTFQPEFINRLSGTVVFNDMDRHMASLILQKKLRLFAEKLKARNVELIVKPEAEAMLLEKGFTQLYGAREMDRVLAAQLKPLLTRELLFGQLRKGGTALISLSDDGKSLLLTSKTHRSAQSDASLAKNS